MTTKIKVKYGTKEARKDFGELTFAKVLAAHRLSEELTQIEMAQRLGISKQSLCDLEKGRKIPSANRAAQIAEILGMLPESFIRLALQDQLKQDDLDFYVEVIPVGKQKKIA